MKIKKYLYKYPQNTSWKYVIQVYRTYIASRKNYKEIIEIYRECVKCNFDMNKMMEIKERYDEKRKSNPMRYIHQNQLGYYFIQKEGKYYCCSQSLEQILEYKDQLEKSNWDKSCLDYKFRKKHDLPRYIRQNKNGKYIVQYKRECYGTFTNLDEAIKERDLLMENCWEYDFVDLV